VIFIFGSTAINFDNILDLKVCVENGIFPALPGLSKTHFVPNPYHPLFLPVHQTLTLDRFEQNVRTRFGTYGFPSCWRMKKDSVGLFGPTAVIGRGQVDNRLSAVSEHGPSDKTAREPVGFCRVATE
jgi:hypothetical protein